MMPRVLLLTSTSAPGFHVAPPLGLHRLRHRLECSGFSCDIHDADLESEAPFLDRVARGGYAVLGFSVSHCNMADDLDRIWRFRTAAQQAKARPLFVAGGQEATLNYAQFLGAGIDMVLMGFAERSLVELCQGLVRQPEVPLRERAQAIPGAVVDLGGGAFAVQPARPLEAEEFRQLSYGSALELELPYHRYWDKIRRDVDAHTFARGRFVVENVRLYTSSHCPRRCGFCSSQSFLPRSQGHELPILALSGEEVHHLILDHHRRYRIKGVLFSDDDFLIGSRSGITRALKLCELVQSSKASGELPGDLMLSCQSRVADFLQPGSPRSVDQRLVSAMAAAGFHSIGLGVETFSDRLLQCPTIHKHGIRSRDCRMVLDALLAAGLCPQINIILGIPESTVKELVDTLDTALDYILQGCQVATTPYILTVPGSPLTHLAGYQTVTRPWIHPVTGARVEIAERLEPSDPLIAEAMARLQEDTDSAVRDLVERSGWGAPMLPKTALGLARFMGLARRLGAEPLSARLHDTACQLLRDARQGPSPGSAQESSPM
jgi:radical SAM superfamily enzyme YgiQ (UPF0313 family)